MSALSALQKEWVENLEEEEKTGVVMWDLSAAYDTLNISILLEKLEIYGIQCSELHSTYMLTLVYAHIAACMCSANST